MSASEVQMPCLLRLGSQDSCPANLDFANAAKDGGPTNTEAPALMDCMDVAPRCGPGKDGMGHMDGPSLFLPASRVISECSTQARNVCHGQGPTWIPILFPQSYLLHIYTIFYPPLPRPNSHILTLTKQDPDKGLHLRETRMPKAQHQDIARPFGFIPWLLVLESIGACKRAQAGGRSRTITCAQSEGARE